MRDAATSIMKPMVDSATVRFTYQDYLNLPEDRRYELIDGDLLLSPSPSEKHQRALLKLAVLLSAFAETNHLRRVYVAPFDVVISDTDVVQPVILFVSNERSSRIGERAVHGTPDLVVEIVSRSTAERDRTIKAKLYARAGARELWLLDPIAKTLEVLVNTESGFRSNSISGAGQIARSPLLPSLAIEVAKLFD